MEFCSQSTKFGKECSVTSTYLQCRYILWCQLLPSTYRWCYDLLKTSIGLVAGNTIHSWGGHDTFDLTQGWVKCRLAWETMTEVKCRYSVSLSGAGHPIVIHNSNGRSKSNPDLLRACQHQIRVATQYRSIRSLCRFCWQG